MCYIVKSKSSWREPHNHTFLGVNKKSLELPMFYNPIVRIHRGGQEQGGEELLPNFE